MINCVNNTYEMATCNICLDDIDPTKMKMLKCGHCYHRLCINQWFDQKSDCPYCRRPVYTYINDKKMEELFYELKDKELAEIFEDVFDGYDGLLEFGYNRMGLEDELIGLIQSYQKSFWKIYKKCKRYEYDYEVSENTLCYGDSHLYKLEQDDITDKFILNKNIKNSNQYLFVY